VANHYSFGAGRDEGRHLGRLRAIIEESPVGSSDHEKYIPQKFT